MRVYVHFEDEGRPDLTWLATIESNSDLKVSTLLERFAKAYNSTHAAAHHLPPPTSLSLLTAPKVRENALSSNATIATTVSDGADLFVSVSLPAAAPAKPVQMMSQVDTAKVKPKVEEKPVDSPEKKLLEEALQRSVKDQNFLRANEVCHFSFGWVLC